MTNHQNNQNIPSPPPLKFKILFKNQVFRRIFYPALFIGLVLILAFQNCEMFPDDLANNDKADMDSRAAGVIDSHLGILNAYLLSDDDEISDSTTSIDHFALNEDILLSFQGANAEVSSFDWKITKGFETVKSSANETREYKTSFESVGIYDIVAKGYDDDSSEPLSVASKKIFIGGCIPRILEIILKKGSLVQGESATFQIDNASDFTNIIWKVNGGTPIEKKRLKLSFDKNDTDVTIEVIASDEDQEDCVSYRKKDIQITDNERPYVNFVKPSDAYSVMLENNEIYKYDRTSPLKNIVVNVEGAKQCEWKDRESVDCDDGLLDITEEDTDKTKCSQSVEELSIFYTSESKNKRKKQKYYKFCPSDYAFCYFGPEKYRPLMHHCVTDDMIFNYGDPALFEGDQGPDGGPPNGGPPIKSTATTIIESSDPEDDDSDEESSDDGSSCKYDSQPACESELPSEHTAGACHQEENSCFESICPSEQQNKHYGVKNGYCYPSCGVACSGSRKEGECASGTACNDTSYIIHYMSGIFYDVSTCCKREERQATANDEGNSADETTSKIIGKCDAGGPNCAGSGQNNAAGCCEAGTFHGHPADTDEEYIWTCRSIPHESPDREDRCSATKNSDSDEENPPNNPTKIIGKCDAGGPNCAGSGQNNAAGCCEAGTFHGHPADTDEEYIWTCRSIPHESPDREDRCSATKNSDSDEENPPNNPTKIIGKCDAGGPNCAGSGQNNAAGCCEAGTFHGHPADTTNEYRWTCRSIPHTSPDREDRCSATKNSDSDEENPPNNPTKIIGKCDAGGPNCAGSGQNNAAGCCEAGTFHGHPADTTNEYRWTCRSIPHTSPDREDRCSATKNSDSDEENPPNNPTKIIGKCDAGGPNCAGSGQNNAAGCCEAGTFHGHPADTTNEYRWTCRSIPHTSPDREDRCSATKNSNSDEENPPNNPTKIIGKCDAGGPNCAGSGQNNAAGCCEAGTFHGHPADTTNEYRWTCRSIPHTSPDREDRCSATKNSNSDEENPPNNPTKIIGKCDAGGPNCAGSGQNNAAGCCEAGTFHGHPADTNEEYIWTCRSIPHTSPDREDRCSATRNSGR